MEKMSRRQIIGFGCAIALVTTAATVSLAQDEDERIRFPTDYAAQFENYLNLDRVQNHNQIIHLFANETAMEGPDEEGRFNNGSVLVGEIYSALADDDGEILESGLGLRIRGDLAAIAVMEKGEGWGASFPDELRNDDWDFAIFSPTGERLDRDLDSCRSCHAPLDEQDHVFSFEHLPNALSHLQ